MACLREPDLGGTGIGRLGDLHESDVARVADFAGRAVDRATAFNEVSAEATEEYVIRLLVLRVGLILSTLKPLVFLYRAVFHRDLGPAGGDGQAVHIGAGL